MPDHKAPNTKELCGDMQDPASLDTGRAYSLPIAPGCARPEGLVVDPIASSTVWLGDDPSFS